MNSQVSLQRHTTPANILSGRDFLLLLVEDGISSWVLTESIRYKGVMTFLEKGGEREFTFNSDTVVGVFSLPNPQEQAFGPVEEIE